MDDVVEPTSVPLPLSPALDNEHVPQSPAIVEKSTAEVDGVSTAEDVDEESLTDLQDIDLAPKTPTQEHAEPSPIPPAKDSFTPQLANGRQRSVDQNGIPAEQPAHPLSPPSHRRSLTLSKGNNVSVVLISSALEMIASSKEAKRSVPLKESTDRALEMIRANHAGDPRAIFEPLRLACETKNERLMTASLDCISKLISYSFFAESDPHQTLSSPPASPGLSAGIDDPNQPALVDLVAHTIASCHSEGAPETVSLQIVKAFLALVLSPTTFVHHSSLLKAFRVVYNVFLLSTDPVNQRAAQGGLTQMVHHVFTRCSIGHDEGKTPLESTSYPLSANHFDDHSLPQTPTTPVPSSTNDVHLNGPINSLPTDSSFSLPLNENSYEKDGGSQTLHPSDAHDRQTHDDNEEVATRPRQLTRRDLFLKDAYQIFRSLCKLSMKTIPPESERDLKSHPMRSKLLSLHLVLTVLNSHMPLIVDPSSTVFSNFHESQSFVQTISHFLCLTLSRNVVSPVQQIFDISVEIFWRVLSGMRTKMKKEIEVLLHEIFIPVLEMRTASLKQKAVILGMFSRLCQDPQALVEIYLNYDCDGKAADNIYEHLMNIISKIATTPLSNSHQKSHEPNSPLTTPTSSKAQPNPAHSMAWNSSALTVSGSMDTANLGLSEGQLKRQGLECLVAVLRSLVAWGTAPRTLEDVTSSKSQPREDASRETLTPDVSMEKLSARSSSEALRQSQETNDDPSMFESAKAKKTTLLDGIKRFNFKPKRGIEFLIEKEFIPSKDPQDVAKFLLTADGLNKTTIGEYLGEGDEYNVSVMHALVDFLDFKDLPFVDALRVFLQAFRLPGEAQKIDRFMLKFAERYIAGNTQTPFANADAAYVLAYSVIMLNTDAHNNQVKNKMTREGFFRNNRGINDSADLPEEFLSSIYDDIVGNEIRMKDEVEAIITAVPSGGPLASALSIGRDTQREAYMAQTSGMANKTEALFKTIVKTQRKGSKSGDQFFSASHYVHVRPMFEVAWIPFLAGISKPLQDTDDMEIVDLCLDAFKSAIRIVTFFDLELERNAFVTTLAKFTFLNNLGEMKTKNMEAIKTLLDVAVTEGNNLKGSWHEVLRCVSQLEHMQLISGGADVSDSSKKGRVRKLPTEELANESRSTHITVAADMVFSLSHFLSGTAIVDFVRALCDVSWEEIQSSGLSRNPRMYSLQKLVEISYYNMNRIRLEWSNMWDILGDHFNQVCCHNNPNVGFFALDSLRQLATRFLEKEELSHFKFQKDFLRPFEHTMIHNANPEIRDMVLQCLQQMIQARVHNMRSGWRTLFGVFQAASKVVTERITNSAFEIVTRLNKDHFPAIVRYGAFADLTVCITDFCKVSKFQKISLLAIAMLRGVIPVMLACPECSWGTSSSSDSAMDDNMIKYWYPVLFSFYDIIMNGEDLEVRRLALDSLFTTLKTYGSTYPAEFWDTVCQELLFPIFSVLKSSQDLSRFSTQEDMSVWLSTTMIQALRDLIDLYTFYFDILERSIDGLLDLLCVCICQENDTLARIGTSCLQQLLESNVSKLSSGRWERIVTTFVKLFKTTTPHQLFDESLRVELDDSNTDISEDTTGQTILPAPLSPHGEQPRAETARVSALDRRRVFKQIIVKCVLQLLLIETTNDLLRNNEVYTTIPPEQLLRLMGVLDHSYQFARMFNDDKELRTGLWKVGFMKHLPNLLKQESSSASTLVHVLLRMYYDPRQEHQTARPQIAERLMPLGLGVIQDYNKLRSDTQGKNIIAWTPVVAEILEGFCQLDDKAFARFLPVIYPAATELLTRDIAPEVRQHLKTYFLRVGYAQGIIEHTP